MATTGGGSLTTNGIYHSTLPDFVAPASTDESFTYTLNESLAPGSDAQGASTETHIRQLNFTSSPNEPGDDAYQPSAKMEDLAGNLDSQFPSSAETLTNTDATAIPPVLSPESQGKLRFIMDAFNGLISYFGNNESFRFSDTQFVAAVGDGPIGSDELVDIDFVGPTPKAAGGWFRNRKVEWIGDRGNGVCTITMKTWGEGMGQTKSISVTYMNGQPIFPQEYLHQAALKANGQSVPVIVDIDFASDIDATEDALRGRDERAALKAAKEKFKDFVMPDGYTWHHLNVDGNEKGQMVLVKTAVHKAFGHAGAFAVWREIQKARAVGDNGHVRKMLDYSKKFITGKLAIVAKVGRVAGPLSLVLYIPVFVEGAEADGVKGGVAEVGRLFIFADEIESLTKYATHPIGEWLTEKTAAFREDLHNKRFDPVNDLPEFKMKRGKIDFNQFYLEHYVPYNPVK